MGKGASGWRRLIIRKEASTLQRRCKSGTAVVFGVEGGWFRGKNGTAFVFRVLGAGFIGWGLSPRIDGLWVVVYGL